MEAVYTTLGALFVALVSGLGILAIQYPKTFRAVGAPLSNIAAGAFILVIAYDTGVTRGAGAVIPLLPPGKLGEAYAARDAVAPDLLIAGGALLGLSVFIFVMGLISIRLETEKEKNPEKNNSSE
jgi:hypothetical protein